MPKAARPRGSACVFELFIDIPHPASSSINDRAKVFDPPEHVNSDIAAEIYEPKNIARIARFAFPDHDDISFLSSVGEQEGSRDLSEDTKNLNLYDIYLFSFFPLHHTFSLQLNDGSRLHGHVRRYLPLHPGVKYRIDVGRRGPRAMVMLTRASGGERFYQAVLKTVEGLTLREVSLPTSGYDEMSVKIFLHALYNGHAQMCEQHDMGTDQAKMRQRCFNLQITGVEFGFNVYNENDDGNRLFNAEDNIIFHLPESLEPGYMFDGLYSYYEDIHSPILPLLRCLNIPHIMRLISALLSEQKIILVSKNITKLSSCVRGAAAILAQGLLIWRHIQIPVLPPHLFKYLASETPYLIGVLATFRDRLQVDQTPGIQDVLCIDLDIDEMSTINMVNPRYSIPDLLLIQQNRKSIDVSKNLAKDLSTIRKADQKLWGIKSDTLGKKDQHSTTNADDSDDELDSKKRNSLKSKIAGIIGLGRKSRKNKRNSAYFESIMKDSINTRDQSDVTTKIGIKEEENSQEFMSLEPWAACENERGEELLRSSLVCFFLEMYGDMGMYLSISKEDKKFWMDRKKFLLRKKQLGEEGTPIFQILQQLSCSLMFEQFARCRIAEIELSANERAYILPRHIPMFALCAKYLTQNRVSFISENIRRLVFTTAESLPQHDITKTRENAKSKTFILTSHKPTDVDLSSSMMTLIEDCRECNGCLCQVMSVIWMKLGETRASLWKETLLALNLLKNLVLHGPLTAIIEAIDGIDKVHALCNYTIKNVTATGTIRHRALQLYNSLLINPLSTLQRRRKVMSLKFEKNAKSPSNDMIWSSYLTRRLTPLVDFRHLHLLFRPNEFTQSSVENEQDYNL